MNHQASKVEIENGEDIVSEKFKTQPPQVQRIRD